MQIGLLFFISTFWTFFPLFTAIFTFPQERAILAKERASDMYRLSAYFMARTLSDVLLDLGLPIVFLVIVYFMASLQKSVEAFFLTLLTIFLTIVTAQVTSYCDLKKKNLVHSCDYFLYTPLSMNIQCWLMNYQQQELVFHT